MWHPEIVPIVNAIVSNVRPNANATPRRPTPTLGKPAEITAVPHPPKTSQNVPINSAANRRDMLMADPPRDVTYVTFWFSGIPPPS
jgi:hypothetical protein